MNQPTRPFRGSLIPLLLVASLVAGPGAVTSIAAQETAEDKEAAKEARISEYLRKKEERRARRDLERTEKEVAGARAEESPAADAAGPEAAEDVVLPRSLQRVQDRVRESQLGQDPTVQRYLDLIASGEASAQQLAAFGNFLGQNLMLREALEYYAVALFLDEDDALMWANVGTLHRQLGEMSNAVSAYARSLSIDPHNGYTHYNLGATLDEMGKYKDAIEEYKVALTLDPSLGEPETNPQAVNNDRLLAVKLMLYNEHGGSVGLPLVDVPDGEANAEEDR
jgi:tetratricopeptide (TPR) repeat protein